MYSVRENPPSHIQNELQAYDSLTQRLLYARGITTQQAADSFFRKEWQPTDPFLYGAMEKAVSRLLDAIAAKETIGIFSDYDCDGIPAAAALYSTFHALGHTDIVYYVPDRNTEGFGLSNKGIAEMINAGVSLVCVLDCGTSSPDEVTALHAAGIEVIIIDHHLAGERVLMRLLLSIPR